MCRSDRWGYSTPLRIPMGFGSDSDVSAFLGRNASCLPQRGESVADRLFAGLIAFEAKRLQDLTSREPFRAFLDEVEDTLLPGATRTDISTWLGGPFGLGVFPSMTAS